MKKRGHISVHGSRWLGSFVGGWASLSSPIAIDEPQVYAAVAIDQLMPSSLGLAVRLSLVALSASRDRSCDI